MAPYHMRPLGSDEIVLSCFSRHTMMDLADLTDSKEWELLVPTAWAQHSRLRCGHKDVFRLPAGHSEIADTMPGHTHAIVDINWCCDDEEGMLEGLCHGSLVDLIP